MANLVFINGFWTGNQYLSLEQMQANALWLWGRAKALGWVFQPFAAMLGNMQQESTLNPGLWEDRIVNPEKGYGLVQWTPSTKYTEWCTQNGLRADTMDAAVARLTWEMDNPVEADQWYPVGTRKTFAEWLREPYTLVPPTRTLVEQFMRSYERPSEEYANLEKRIEYAEYWSSFLSDTDPPDPGPTPSFGARKKWIFSMRSNGRLALYGSIKQRRFLERHQRSYR